MNHRHLIAATALAAALTGCASTSSTTPPLTAASTIPGVTPAPIQTGPAGTAFTAITMHEGESRLSTA